MCNMINSYSLKHSNKNDLKTLTKLLSNGNRTEWSPVWSVNDLKTLTKLLSNGNRTEWSPVRSVIIQVINKSEDRGTGVRFVYHSDLFIIYHSDLFTITLKF